MEAQKPTYDDLAPDGHDGLWLWQGKPPNPTQLPTPLAVESCKDPSCQWQPFWFLVPASPSSRGQTTVPVSSPS